MVIAIIGEILDRRADRRIEKAQECPKGEKHNWEYGYYEKKLNKKTRRFRKVYVNNWDFIHCTKCNKVKYNASW